MSVKEAIERRTSIGAQRNPASEEAILRAAEEILVESGLGAFSIEAVAKRAKAGKPTIYRWWPSRAVLLLDVYHRQKTVPMPDTGKVEEDVFLFLTALFRHWRQTGSGAIFRSVIAEAQSDAAAAEALAVYAAGRRKHTGEIFQRARARGELADWADPELLAETVSSFAWNRLLTNRLDPEPEDLRLFIRQLTEGVRA